MGPVSRHVADRVQEELAKRRLLVWYDQEQTFRAVAEAIEDGISRLDFDGSYFRLRQEAEQILTIAEPGAPSALLIYVPVPPRPEPENPLLALECLGSRLDEDLQTLARQALTGLHPDAKIDEWLGTAGMTLAKLDDLSVKAEELGALAAVFGKVSPQEAIRKWVCTPDLDAELENHKLIGELRALLDREYGVVVPGNQKKLPRVRSAFVQRALLNEFLDDLDSIAPELTELTLPDSEARIRACRDLAQSLRDRLSMQADYAEWAGAAERTFGLSGLQVDPSAIGDRDTFPFEERLALQRLCQLAETERWAEAGVWADQHASSFWVRTDPARQSDWHTARKAVELGGILSTTADQTPKMSSARDLVQRYVDQEGGIGLWAINKMARELDTLRSRPSLNERAEELAATVSEKAAAWERALAEQFVDAIRANPEDLGQLPAQVSIFASAVTPLLASDHRVVFVLADALRYEMGQELADTLEDGGEVDLSFALATPPTITKVGMAALVPQADSGLRLVGGPGGAQSYAGSLPLPSVAERRGAYADEYGSRFLDLTLDECLTLKTKQLQKRVEDASLILLRSQELDEIGEADKLVQARQWMAQVLANLRQAVARLTSAGASAFVIVADHGFLLRDDITDAEKLDAPTGEVIELHRRCVIGRGLASSATAPVFDAPELGVRGDLQLAFPRGVNVFKVPGGNLSYVHGGISLQELIVPVIVYRPEAVTTSGKAQVTLEVTAKKATTAFLQVKLAYAAAGLFDQESKRRLRIDVLLDDERIGGAVSASTGFTEAGKSLSLASGEESTVFLQLENPPTGQGMLTLKVVDEELGESVLTKKVPYDIAF